MRNRSRHPRSTVEGLRLAIDCMPVATREAMLEGITRYERIIVGAYTDEQGGVCPMLAAHRCGGRTDFLSFAKSWDRFARGRKGSRTHKRAATQRELRILIDQLQSSLDSDSGIEFDSAIAEHRALLAAGHRRRARLAGEADPRGIVRARRLRFPRRRKASDEPAERPVVLTR